MPRAVRADPLVRAQVLLRNGLSTWWPLAGSSQEIVTSGWRQTIPSTVALVTIIDPGHGPPLWGGIKHLS